MNAPYDLKTVSLNAGPFLLRPAQPPLAAPPDGSVLQQLFRTTVQREQGRCGATFKGYRLDSAYQPIFGLAHRRAVGYEALLRAFDASGNAVSPLTVFSQARGSEETVHLDRVSRVLHTHNFQPLAAADQWLFLNINPRVVVEGKSFGPFFAELLHHSGLRPSQVVVEILENSILDEGLLAEAVQYYKQLGCLVALDDFGAGHSNFDRIVRLAPNMVKLDRSFLQQARQSTLARRMLPSLITLLHEAGCLVVLEGIEDETEALLAIEAEADFAQGYYFARPAAASALQQHDTRTVFDNLNRRARDELAVASRRRDETLQGHVETFRACTEAFAAGHELETAARPLVADPRVVRCYVLDADGVQVGSNVITPHAARHSDGRFAPLRETAGCDWSGRHYFRRAVTAPGTVQITRPYLSITGAHMTTTLSLAVQRDGVPYVVCCDLYHAD